MKTQQHINTLKKVATSMLGVAAASVLIGSPAGAQNSGVLNPRPSIFNEPPYNKSGSSQPDSGSMTTPSTPSTDSTTEAESSTIVGVAAANGSFKILTAALKAAGLDKTLEGKGPFTVFAPTDEAFNALPADALNKLLQPEHKDLLIKILTYHVVSGKVTSNQLKSGPVTTVEGSPLVVKVSKSGVIVNNAKVIKADIPASNGVIHVIDRVMLPRDLQSSGSK